MGAVTTLFAAAVVVLLPGATAVWWDRATAQRTSALPRSAAGWTRGLAVAYGGVGVSCVFLWLAATFLGLSMATALGAPLAGSLLLAGTAWRRQRAAREERRGEGRGADTRPVGAAGDISDGEAGRATAPHLVWLVGAGLLAALAVMVVSLPYGWQATDGVHRMAMTDWEKHLVMASGVAASEVFPPPHPYIHAVARPAYHLGYQLLAAAIHVGGGRTVDLYPILLALTLLTAAAIPLVAHRLAGLLCRPREAVMAAVGASLLVGFDLVVVILEALRAALTAWPLSAGLSGLRAVVPSTHVDFWIHHAERQFNAPLVATMWAPHHVAAALLSALAVALLAPPEGGGGRRRGGWLLPALLIAALPALSAYVALALAVGVAGAVVGEALMEPRRLHRTESLRRWGPPGLLGLVLAAPTFPVLLSGSSPGLVLSPSAAGTWSNGAVFSWLFGDGVWTRLLDTPAVYLVDFGIIGMLGGWALYRLWRAGEIDVTEREALAMLLAVLLLATFVRPPPGVSNNVYARGLLVAWLLMAPFAAIAAVRWAPRRWLLAGILICAAGSVYAVVGYVLEGTLFWGVRPALVETMCWVNDNRPADAVVALDPRDEDHGRVGYWLRRPTVLSNPRLALMFGATEKQVRETERGLAAAFDAADTVTAARRFDALEADTIVARPGRGFGVGAHGNPPAWARPPCFQVLRAGPEWLVVARRAEAC